jgi:murein tripeptide amidase MpaA
MALVLACSVAAPGLPSHPAHAADGASRLDVTERAATPGTSGVAVERPRRYVEPYRFPIDFKHFYDYEDLSETLQRIAAEFPGLTELRVIGESREGRDLWMMRVTDESTGDPDLKPAMYVDGNIHGNEVQAAEVCLYVISELVNRADRDDRIGHLLATRTFYVVPTVNPDSRAYFFSEPNSPHTPRQNVRPFDDDLDGRIDEDGPEDLNGDGYITSMRKRDLWGNRKTGDDPRHVPPRELDEPGEWTVYFWEGVDNDGDGRINEDWRGGVDLNRNFPAEWQPWSTQWGSGPYPTSEPEIRAVVDFMLERPNIAGVQTFHNSGNLILYPPGARSAEDLPSRDRRVYRTIYERGHEILPDYEPGSVMDDLYRVYGSTLDFGYVHLGAISFSNELWGWPTDYDGDGDVSWPERLRWSDERLGGEAFVEWTPFEHPELGPVEIGGWSQFHSRMPPVGFLEELCRLNSDFVLFHAEATPLLEITRTDVTEVSDGVLALDVFVANSGIMDTYPELAEQLGTARPVIAELTLPDGATALEGARRERDRPLRAITYSPVDRRIPDPLRIEAGQIQGGEEIAVRWLIQGGEGAEARVRIRSDKAGRAETRITLTPGD